ncbi:MAG: hypothetical protein KF788_03615 [Piscinibacter sp.]|nr:hypothetical protein [Piscinibacter sp.]
MSLRSLPFPSWPWACLLIGLLIAGPAAAGGCFTVRDGRTVCPKPDARCLPDRYGDVRCSAPGGGVALDRYGAPVCGPGYCTRDLRGDVFCSSAPRGAADVDRHGKAVCAEGCVPARAEACTKLE